MLLLLFFCSSVQQTKKSRTREVKDLFTIVRWSFRQQYALKIINQDIFKAATYLAKKGSSRCCNFLHSIFRCLEDKNRLILVRILKYKFVFKCRLFTQDLSACFLHTLSPVGIDPVNALEHECNNDTLHHYESRVYTLFQNGRHFSFLLIDCKLAFLTLFKVKYSFEFYV